MSDKVEGISRSEQIRPIEDNREEEGTPPHSEQAFSPYMRTGKPEAGEASSPDLVSPLDLPGQGRELGVHPSTDALLGQMHATSSTLGDLQAQLNRPNLALTKSQQYLLRNKLTDTNRNIRAVARKVGVDVAPSPEVTSSRRTPIARFLDLLTDSQTQLSRTHTMIRELSANGGEITPSKLLLIQVKLSTAQQELEYSSILLNKSVDSVKQIFNIQI